jgi:hypothetical protein
MSMSTDGARWLGCFSDRRLVQPCFEEVVLGTSLRPLVRGALRQAPNNRNLAVPQLPPVDAADLECIARHELAPRGQGLKLDPIGFHKATRRPAIDLDQLRSDPEWISKRLAPKNHASLRSPTSATAPTSTTWKWATFTTPMVKSETRRL